MVNFTAANGQAVYYDASDFCANPPRYQMGQTIKVLYDPQNPNHVQFAGFVGEFGEGILFTFLGLVFFLFGVWVYFWARKMRQADMQTEVVIERSKTGG